LGRLSKKRPDFFRRTGYLIASDVIKTIKAMLMGAFDMKVAVLKERRDGEARVAATPETVKKMVNLGLDVQVEKDAGEAASFTNEAYKAAGASIGATLNATLKDATIVLKVRRPFLASEDKVDELKAIPANALLICLLDPYGEQGSLTAYAKAKVTTLSLELIPRITRAQSMDVLSSQSNLVGYRAVLEAAYEYGRVFPMMMTAAGTIPPAKVLILGAGVAGLQAIATARRLGAVVSAFDVRAVAKEQVESLGAKFIEVTSDETGEAQGGYAKEMSATYKKKQSESIHTALKQCDIAIATALIPGKRAPILITEKMVRDMKPGSVIVDTAIEMGGNCEGAKLGKVVLVHGVKIIGYGNLPARLATESSALFARNIFNLLSLIYDAKEKTLKIDAQDEILSGSILTHSGKIIHPNFKT
jgi:NAD(P) transhydrogenase subunit alpha